MNKNGFTLIELLSIIIIIGIVSLIVVPTVASLIDNAENSLYEQQVKTIELAAKKWGLDNVDLMPDENSLTSCVNVSDLQTAEFLDAEITNPKTKEVMGGSVKIEFLESFKQYQYTYQPNNCGG